MTKGGRNRPLHEVLLEIRDGKWAGEIARLRALPYKSQAYDKQKEKLSAFMLSASTRTGGHKKTDIAEHTGLLQVDVDNLSSTEEAKALRDWLGKDPYIFAAWLSPGGRGVKAAICVCASVENHGMCFAAAESYIKETYAVQIDTKCKDPCRLCFVSHDPDLRVNENSSALPIDEAKRAPGKRGPDEVKSEIDSSPSLHAPCSIAILHNNTFFEEFPGLKPLYKKHVTLRVGTPQKGLRNEALVEMVSNLCFVVHPRFVPAFAAVFYENHEAIFADYPKERFTNQVHNLMNGCFSGYQSGELTPVEADLYAQMHDEKGIGQAAFRISRSLAFCESDASLPPPMFCMSDEHMGVRLGVLDMEAWRIFRKMEKLGIIRRISTGKFRAKGVKPESSRYVWLPEPTPI